MEIMPEPRKNRFLTYIIIPLSILLMVTSSCKSTEDDWANTAYGVLANHGFPEEDSVVGLLTPPDHFQILSPEDKKQFWKLLNQASSTVRRPDRLKELRLEADGSGAARIIVDENDLLLIQPFLRDMDEPITILHELFLVPGVYDFLASLSNRPSIRIAERKGERILRPIVNDKRTNGFQVDRPQ